MGFDNVLMWWTSYFNTKIYPFIVHHLFFRNMWRALFMRRHLTEIMFSLFEYSLLLHVCVKYLISVNVHTNHSTKSVKHAHRWWEQFWIITVVNDAISKLFLFPFIPYFMWLRLNVALAHKHWYTVPNTDTLIDTLSCTNLKAFTWVRDHAAFV